MSQEHKDKYLINSILRAGQGDAFLSEHIKQQVCDSGVDQHYAAYPGDHYGYGTVAPDLYADHVAGRQLFRD